MIYLDSDSTAQEWGAATSLCLVSVFAGYALFFEEPEIDTLRECVEDSVVLEHHDRRIFDDYVVTSERGHEFVYDNLRDAADTFWRLSPSCL